MARSLCGYMAMGLCSYMTRGGGGYSRFQVTGMIEGFWGV